VWKNPQIWLSKYPPPPKWCLLTAKSSQCLDVVDRPNSRRAAIPSLHRRLVTRFGYFSKEENGLL